MTGEKKREEQTHSKKKRKKNKRVDKDKDGFLHWTPIAKCGQLWRLNILKINASLFIL
jgi:hypothetical protein